MGKAMLAATTQLLGKAQRRLWMKYALRGVGGSDNHARLDLAYRMPDPWNMASAMERARFEATNRIIGQAFGRPASVLELGCGEGHQTGYLARACDQVYGVDVSAHAIERAHARVTKARFAVADIFSQPWGDERHRFDLVTACEVLYYLRDPAATIERMQMLGRNGLVTFFAPAVGRLGDVLERVPGLHKDWIHAGATSWLVGWWTDHDGA